MQRRLEGPLRIRDVAKLIDKDYEWTRRTLLKMNDELHGTLLTVDKSGKAPRYTLTRAALRRAFPDWFISTTTLNERLDDLSYKVEMLEKAGSITAATVGQLRRQINKLAS